MNILAFLFIGGLTLKAVLFFIESLIDRLNLKYDVKIISLPVTVEQNNFNLEMNVETVIEAGSNSLKPLGKQIYMGVASQKMFSV